MLRKKNGFSLTEVLVVIIVIGIISAIALPLNFQRQNLRKEEQVKDNAYYVEILIDNYASTHDGIYPTLEELQKYILIHEKSDLKNPFTGKRENVAEIGWRPGGIGYASTDFGYIVVGYGKKPTSGPGKDGIVFRDEIVNELHNTYRGRSGVIF